jgi:hypothetical protein
MIRQQAAVRTGDLTMAQARSRRGSAAGDPVHPFHQRVLLRAERELSHLGKEIESLYPTVQRLDELMQQRDNLMRWVNRHRNTETN